MSTKAVITMFTAAACVATAGLYGVEVPAIAQPMRPLPLVPSKDCDWQVFATDSDIDQGNGTVVHIQWNNSGRGTASYTSQNISWQGPLSGPVIIKGTNELDFSVPFKAVEAGFSAPDPAPAAPTNNYSGSIDQNTGASGTWNNNSGASGTWTMGPTFKCIAHAPAAASAPQPQQDSQQAPQQPAETAPVTNAISPSFDASGNTVFKVTVKNSSKLPATCDYEAVSQSPLLPSDTTRTFDVPANASHTESFDGVKTGTNYTITINCRDSSGSQTEPLGSVNQTVKW